MKQALIISPYFAPLASIAAYRVCAVAQFLKEEGYHVTVICDDWGALTEQDESIKIIQVACRLPLIGTLKNRRTSSAIANKARFTRRGVLSRFREKTGIFRTARMPDQYDFWIWQALPYIYRGNYDLVYSSSGPYASHLLALLIRLKKRSKFWIADYRDLWVDNHIYSGLFPFTLIESFLERLVNNAADLISVATESQMKILKHKYSQKTIKVIMNGYDSIDGNLKSTEPYYWNEKKVRIVYTGTMYADHQDISPLFQAISNIRNTNQSDLLEQLEVFIVGDVRLNIIALANEYNVSKWLKVTGLVSHDEAKRIQRDADVLLFLAWDNDPTIVTGKVFEYINSRTPIWSIGGCKDDIATNLIISSNCGCSFGHDISEIEKALISLLTAGRPNRTVPSRHFLNTYSRRAQLSNLKPFLVTQ